MTSSRRHIENLDKIDRNKEYDLDEAVVLLVESSHTKFDETTELKVLGKYRNLSKIRLLKPTIKRYLAGHVKSSFRRVDADEFTVATLLPVQRFTKASEEAVWKDSRGMI